LVAVGAPLRPIELANAGAAGVLAKALKYGHSGLSVGLRGRWYEASNLLPAPRDDDLLAAFDALEELREVRLCFESANRGHWYSPSQ
jgi:hypothetical protein